MRTLQWCASASLSFHDTSGLEMFAFVRCGLIAGGWDSIAGVVGFVLNLASLWCNQSVTATTYAVVGAMNKIPLLLLGAVLFTNAITSQQWLYISASMVRPKVTSSARAVDASRRDSRCCAIHLAQCGGFLYSYVKFKEKQREQQGKPILPTQSRP